MSDAKSAIDKTMIRDLAALMDETGLTEIEIEQNAMRLRVARQPAPMAAYAPMPAPAAAPVAAAASAAPAKAGAEHPGTVKSPMVGTAYRSPEPGAQPFVEIGAKVQSGQTVLIVEAMKTMNHIPAPKPGTVVQIMVQDGQPVEYGEPLLVIE
ncbi:MAG: acetyl-CoA carboxylase biotin carboxyl carrier protein [Hyphomicrobiaceae bacterium]